MSFGKPFFIALLVVFAGCTSSAPSVRIRISGGEKLMVDLARGGAIGPENEYLTIKAAGVLLNSKEKKVSQAFGIELKKTDPTLRRVKVEDVSEATSQPLVDDTNPEVKARGWRWIGPLMEPDDKSLTWIYNIDETFRVYRFTIVLSDGRELVIYHAAFYSPFMKFQLRTALGLETH
jgi:hypothetical protein